MMKPHTITPRDCSRFLATRPFPGILTMAIAACTYHHQHRRTQKQVEALFPDLVVSMSRREQIASALVYTGLMSSQRGPGGGYVMLRPVSELTFADVLPAYVYDGATQMDKRGAPGGNHLFPERSPQAFPAMDVLYEVLIAGMAAVRIADVYPDLIKRSDDAAAGSPISVLPAPEEVDSVLPEVKVMAVNAVNSIFNVDQPVRTVLSVSNTHNCA